MTFAAAVLLGVIQGLTEFLPVSSSAHLILARAFFGWEVPPQLGLAFDVAVHIGTLGAIVIFFRREVGAMALSLPAMFERDPGEPGWLLRRIAVGTIPVVIVGALYGYVEHVLRTPAVAAGALTVGAIGMIVAERIGSRERTESSMSWTDALLIGCAQASALIPGMSRSGATITVGMFLGMRRDAAARFTFLLAIPAMIAAAAKETLEVVQHDVPFVALQLFGVGMLVSAAVGYLTIKYFLRFLAGNRMDVFAYYRLGLAAATVIWLLAQ